MNVAPATSAYELWARALRAWSLDPTTDLSSLPVLDETSLPPATFQRLTVHLSIALQRFTDRWADTLTTRLRQTPTPFARAQVMIDAKRMLARRLLLAQHPGLPASLRQALWDGACSDVTAMQRQLEETVAHGSTIDTSGRDAAFFREHSLTTLLAPGFPLADFIAGRYKEPEADTAPAAAVPDQTTAPERPPGLRGNTPRVLPTW
jgi:hypothetical protein